MVSEKEPRTIVTDHLEDLSIKDLRKLYERIETRDDQNHRDFLVKQSHLAAYYVMTISNQEQDKRLDSELKRHYLACIRRVEAQYNCCLYPRGEELATVRDVRMAEWYAQHEAELHAANRIGERRRRAARQARKR